MPPEAPTSPSVAPASAPTKEDDGSQAGSMTLLLPQQVVLTHPLPQQGKPGKQADQGLPMPSLPRSRRRLVVRASPTSSARNCTTWVLLLLTAAAVMAAVAAAAVAMAARAEIFRLRAEVDSVRTRLAYHETVQNIHRMLEPQVQPVQDDEEDVVWEPEDQPGDDLSPTYPEMNEFEFAADVKGSSVVSRHSRRHIPMVSGSYESSENGWRPEKPEKRLKLYGTLASASSPPQPAETPKKVPGEAFERPKGPYLHRSSSGRLVPAMTAPQVLRATPVPAVPAVPVVPAVPYLTTTDRVVVARRQDPIDS